MPITEKDVIDTWVYWHSLGLEPPPVEDKYGFMKAVRNMWAEFRGTDVIIWKFAAAAAAKDMAKSGKWPQNFRIGMHIALQKNLRKAR